MTNWEWVTNVGKKGKMPVRVLQSQQAQFLPLDFLENTQDVRITYELAIDAQLVPGDVCIFSAQVSDVRSEKEPTMIAVEVLDIEFLQRGDSKSTRINEMMTHLEEARRQQQNEQSIESCTNCASIEGGTRLSVETRQDGRDLHYCAQCDRLLSTEEYQEWMEIHR